MNKKLSGKPGAVQSVAFLRRRAEQDVDIVQRLLRSRGYFNGTVEVSVAALPVPEDADPDDPARAEVTITVEPGEAFTLARHEFHYTDPSDLVPQLDAGELGAPVGEAAVAEEIILAENAAVEALHRAGFPYALAGRRRAVADLEEATLEVDTPLQAGPAGVFGPITFVGLEDVTERYLRTYVSWEEGATFDRRELRRLQRKLLTTGLFANVSAEPPPEPPQGAGPVPLPVTVTAEERPFQTVSAGAKYSTDDGPSIRGSYEHRNLFGENETIRLGVDLGLELQTIGINYRVPQYRRPGQDIVFGVGAIQEEDDAFDHVTLRVGGGLERRLSPRWVVGAGALAESSLITDVGQEFTAALVGLPVSAEYDGSDDKLNPTRGARGRLELTPFAGTFDDEPTAFLTVDTRGSYYLDLTGDERYILATRGRVASILAGSLSEVPQTRRLYAGGGGSVRGYANRYVGPLDILQKPVGGLSALEAVLEMRAQLYGSLGGVVFVDAGSVSTQSIPNFEAGVQTAAGLGFRYYSPVGPIALDVAFPLDPRGADDAYQIYFSIGQAF